MARSATFSVTNNSPRRCPRHRDNSAADAAAGCRRPPRSPRFCRSSDDGVAAGPREAGAEMHGVEKPMHLIHVRSDIRVLDALEGLEIFEIEPGHDLAGRENLLDAVQLHEAQARQRDRSFPLDRARRKKWRRRSAPPASVRDAGGLRRRSPRSSVTIIPPSPQIMAPGCEKSKTAQSPKLPTRLSLIDRADRLGGIFDQDKASPYAQARGNRPTAPDGHLCCRRGSRASYP